MKKQTQPPVKTAAPIELPKKSSTQKTPLKKILCIATLIAIVVFAGALAYHHDQRKKADELAFRADKVRFAVVDKEVSAARDRAVQSLGKPDVEKYGRTCSRTSQKYSEGLLYCSIHFSLAYANDSQQKFISNGKVVSQAIGEMNYVANQTLLDDYLNSLQNKSRSISLNYSTGGSVGCELHADYTSPDYRDDLKTIKSTRVELYSFQCTDLVKKPMYPLAE